MERENNAPYIRHGPDDPFGLSEIVKGFEKVSLAEVYAMKARLLTRMESKHPMTLSQCRDLLRKLTGSYAVLDIKNTRVGRYETLYFDTPSFLTYLQHHNGRGNRFKLRLRHYESSGETYLEVKKKNNKGSTEKERLKTCWSDGLRPEHEDFLASAFPYDFRKFSPVLMTQYRRLTLVSADPPERITFDTGISFRHGRRTVSYPEFVIGEVKYERGNKNSPAQAALRSMAIPRQGFSKYCIGI